MRKRSLEEKEHGRMVFEVPVRRDPSPDPRLVMVFKEAELVVVCGINGFLKVQQVRPRAQRAAALKKTLKSLPDIVLIFHVKGFEGLGISCRVETRASARCSRA